MNLEKIVFYTYIIKLLTNNNIPGKIKNDNRFVQGNKIWIVWFLINVNNNLFINIG